MNAAGHVDSSKSNPESFEHVCPVCRGLGRAKHHNNLGLQDIAKGKIHVLETKFPTLLDPEYKTKGYPATWSTPFHYVCAGCLGSGQRTDWVARVLSGEFVPHEANS